MNCNTCKNPISTSSLHCEWCGARVIQENRNLSNSASFQSNSITDFMDKLNEIENEIIKENSGAGTWGALDGMLTRAFGNSKIDSLNQKKATIIQTFPLPKNPDDLLEMANLASANFKNTKINKVALTDNARKENKMNKPIRDAWKAKTEQAIGQLEIYGRNDDFIRQQIENLKSRIHEEKKGWF